MIPITRIEKFLNGIIYWSSVPEPITRIEVMLNDIKNGDVVSLTPITREEIYLAKISGANVEIPTPITREEMYLAKIAGLTIETPSPIVRIEHWLNNWAGGSDPLNTFTGAIVRFFSRFEKPIVKIEANFTPIQDLNGQEAPWPPGGGKNKFSFANISSKNIYRANVQQMGTDPNAFYMAGAAGYSDTMQLSVASWAYVCTWIDYQTTAETTITVSCKVKNYSADCNGFIRIRYNDTQNREGSTAAATTFFNDVGEYQVAVTATIPSGKYVGLEFSPAAKASDFTLTQYTEVTEFQLEIGSTATAFAPYSNICPISGHTGCEVVRDGKNLLENTATTSTVNGTTFTVNDDGTVTVSGTPTANAGKAIHSGLFWDGSFADGVISFDSLPTGLRVYCKRVAADGTTSYPTLTASGSGLSSGYKYYDLTLQAQTSFNGSPFTVGFQLELGSTASDYVPYSGTTLTIPFNATYYGGHVVVYEDGSADVVVDRENIDIGNMLWSDGVYSNFVSASVENTILIVPTSTVPNLLCSALKTIKFDDRSSATGARISINQNGRIDVRGTPYASAAEFKTEMTGQKIVYELASPTTVHLTSVTMLNTLVGENVVFSDLNGDLTVQAYGTEIT